MFSLFRKRRTVEELDSEYKNVRVFRVYQPETGGITFDYKIPELPQPNDPLPGWKSPDDETYIVPKVLRIEWVDENETGHFIVWIYYGVPNRDCRGTT